MSSAHNIHFKVLVGFQIFNGRDDGVILLSDNDTLSSLFVKLSAIYKRVVLQVSYIDNEDEEILCNSECEFKEFLNIVRDFGNRRKYTTIHVKAGHLLPWFSRRRLRKMKMKSIACDHAFLSEKLKKRDSSTQVDLNKTSLLHTVSSISPGQDISCKEPPVWFINYMRKFKEDLMVDLIGSIQTLLKDSRGDLKKGVNDSQEDLTKGNQSEKVTVHGSSKPIAPSKLLHHNKQIETEHNYATSNCSKEEQNKVLIEMENEGAQVSKIDRAVLLLGEMHCREEEDVIKDESDFGEDEFSVLSGEISVTDTDSENERASEDFMIVPMPPCFDGLKESACDKSKGCGEVVLSKQADSKSIKNSAAVPIEIQRTAGMMKQTSVPVDDLILSKCGSSALGENKTGDLAISNENNHCSVNQPRGRDLPSSINIMPDVSKCKPRPDDITSKVNHDKSIVIESGGSWNDFSMSGSYSNTDTHKSDCGPSHFGKFEQLTSVSAGHEAIEHPKLLNQLPPKEAPSREYNQARYPIHQHSIHQPNQHSECEHHNSYHSTLYPGPYHSSMHLPNGGGDIFSYSPANMSQPYLYEPPWHLADHGSEKRVFPEVQEASKGMYQVQMASEDVLLPQAAYQAPSLQPFRLQCPNPVEQQYLLGTFQQQGASSPSQYMSDICSPEQHYQDSYYTSRQESPKISFAQQSHKGPQHCSPYNEPVTILPEKLMQLASSAVTTACNIVGSLGKSSNDFSSSDPFQETLKLSEYGEPLQHLNTSESLNRDDPHLSQLNSCPSQSFPFGAECFYPISSASGTQPLVVSEEIDPALFYTSRSQRTKKKRTLPRFAKH